MRRGWTGLDALSHGPRPATTRKRDGHRDRDRASDRRRHRQALDRLPPGQGTVPFRDVFGRLAAKGYTGPLSDEARNPAARARPAAEVAREALAATRAVLP